MELILLGLAALGGGGSYVVWKVRGQRFERRQRATELEAVQKLAEEDVTIFGEQLQRLGEDLEGSDLDQETRDDYQNALDAYEHAKWTAPRLATPDEISTLIDTLATGRYRLACVRARVAGRPVPEIRVPCFFNPQHGPSTRNVMYTVPRRGTRQVPACGQCAARVTAREKPEIRTVDIGQRKVAYWEAGAAFMPYSKGYFPAQGSTVADLTWAHALAQGGSFAAHRGPFSAGSVGDFGFGGDSAGGDGGGEGGGENNN